MMSETAGAAMGLSRFLLWVLIGMNIVLGAMMLGGFIASFVFEQPLVGVLRRWLQGPDIGLLLPTARIWLLLVLPGVAAAHLLFRRTLDLLRSVREGQPFAAENAQRLRIMAWCLLAIQVIHLGSILMAQIASRAVHQRIEVEMSVVGWLAVFLLFVLSRVFEEGARNRSELEGMI